jgi:hypothetical protein
MEVSYFSSGGYTMRYVLFVCCILLCAVSVEARDIAGVSVPETMPGDKGAVLTLNGAGIRSKLFFKIYIAQLYLEKPANEAAEVLAADGQKKMIMHFLYEKVSKEQLVEAWNEGFNGNLDEHEKVALAPRINQFNEMFATVGKGDTILLAYVPESGTKVVVAGKEKGIVPGKDFSDALLSIWLGEKPITPDLKKALLNYGK